MDTEKESEFWPRYFTSLSLHLVLNNGENEYLSYRISIYMLPSLFLPLYTPVYCHFLLAHMVLS